MAPKAKISRQDIIDAALGIVEMHGKEELNARSLAIALGTSTQPIFSNFKSMGEVQEEVARMATDIYLDYINKTVESGLYPAYKASGMAYIRFAKEKRELFKLVFMDSAGKHSYTVYDEIINAMANTIGISYDEACEIHLRMWVFVHGIATMLATEYVDFTYEYASGMISDIYNGLVEKRKKSSDANA